MTLIVGLRCSDGVVIASDSAATFGANGSMTIGQQEMQKVCAIASRVLYAGTGAVGMAQLLIDRIGNMWAAKSFSGSKSPAEAMNLLGLEISKLVGPYMHSAQVQRALVGDASTSLVKSLVALPVAKQPCLFQFDFNGAPEEVTTQLPFVALGSGQPIADPFLAFLKRVFWPTTVPTLAEGRLVAVWTISHVAQTNPGGVGGRIQLATLSARDGKEISAAIEAPDAIQEHEQKVVSAESALVAFVRGQQASAAAVIPAVPRS